MHFESDKILELSPLGVIICDSEQRIVWTNQKFLEETSLDKNNVIGQLFLSLPIEAIDKQTHTVQLFSDNQKTAKQFSYWNAEWCTNESFTVHFYALVRDQAKKLHPAIKVPKRPNWVEFLDYEVSRSRRYDNPLCLLKLHVLIQNQPEQISDEQIAQTIKDTLMNELRWADMIGHTNKDSFLMVLPETPSSALKLLISKITRSLESQLGLLSSELQSQVVFGSTYWQKHDDSQKMLQRARTNLVKSLEKIIDKSKD